ncbi:MAG: hypothetical protein WBH39_04835, partial [Candidatus Microthrix parvicella]
PSQRCTTASLPSARVLVDARPSCWPFSADALQQVAVLRHGPREDAEMTLTVIIDGGHPHNSRRLAVASKQHCSWADTAGAVGVGKCAHLFAAKSVTQTSRSLASTRISWR